MSFILNKHVQFTAVIGRIVLVSATLIFILIGLKTQAFMAALVLFGGWGAVELAMLIRRVYINEGVERELDRRGLITADQFMASLNEWSRTQCEATPSPDTATALPHTPLDELHRVNAIGVGDLAWIGMTRDDWDVLDYNVDTRMLRVRRVDAISMNEMRNHVPLSQLLRAPQPVIDMIRTAHESELRAALTSNQRRDRDEATNLRLRLHTLGLGPDEQATAMAGR